MSNLGHDPELELQLFCNDCRGGAHGQVVTYDATEVKRLLAAGELEVGGQCVRCGQEKDEDGNAVSEEERERRAEARQRKRHKPHAEEQREGAEFKDEKSEYREVKTESKSGSRAS